MVWNQYVWEATTGTEVYYFSDDEDFEHDTPLSYEEWEFQYDEVLRMMWNTIRTLLYDASITHDGKFSDFVDFCYEEHIPDDSVTWFDTSEKTEWMEERLFHIWKNIARIIVNNNLQSEIMRGVTFENFVLFCKNDMHAT